MDNLLTFFVANSAAIVAILGLLFTTIEFVAKAYKEKNWAQLVALVLTDMTEAEKLFIPGEDKKAYCLERLQDHASKVGYILDDESIYKISKLIDDVCLTSKSLNNKGGVDK